MASPAYALGVFLAAFLLFQVELILGKAVLPWFGGTPAVWTTCMMGFQILLLGGYAGAHALASRFSTRVQGRVYVGMLLVSAGWLVWHVVSWGDALLPPECVIPPAGALGPARAIAALLLSSVAIPFLGLAAAGPLLQSWYSCACPSGNAYRLYALSNVGSVFALVSYPFAVEPAMTLHAQSALWAGLFAVVVLAVIACSLGLPGGSVAASAADTRRPGSRPDERPSPSAGVQVLWFLLPAATCSALLAFTNELCQGIGVVPLLWVLPLVLYLLSFVFVFAGERFYSRRAAIPVACLLTVATVVLRLRGMALPAGLMIASLAVLLFAVCLVGHGELVRLRPRARYLTRFYLMMAAGGALGGTLVAVVAPLCFSGYWEFELSLMAIWGLAAWSLYRDRSSSFHGGDRLPAFAVLLVLGYAAGGPVLAAIRAFVPGWARLAAAVDGRVLRLVVVALPVAVGLSALLRRTRLAASGQWSRLLVGLVLLVLEAALVRDMAGGRQSVIASARDFYGVVRVREVSVPGTPYRVRQLSHGRVNHGYQFLSDELRDMPVSYYAPGSGVSYAFEYYDATRTVGPTPTDTLRIGVTGLGAGGLAPYATRGDSIRFYEINPQVVRFARQCFSYLDDCQGDVQVVLGDARMAMRKELRETGSDRYDILILDAFTSDAVPVHLLTVEAFELYLAHLRDADGILAVNISNRFLDFRPLMAGIAARFGLGMAWIPFGGTPPAPAPSSWVLLTRNRAFLQHPDVRLHTRPYAGPTVLWTDTHSALLPLLVAGPPAVSSGRAQAQGCRTSR